MKPRKIKCTCSVGKVWVSDALLDEMYDLGGEAGTTLDSGNWYCGCLVIPRHPDDIDSPEV